MSFKMIANLDEQVISKLEEIHALLEIREEPDD